MLVGGRYENESDEEAEYWENYSVWRPGRLITTERDDLMSEQAAELAAQDREIERAQWAPSKPRTRASLPGEHLPATTGSCGSNLAASSPQPATDQGRPNTP